MLQIAGDRVLGYLHNSQLYGFDLKAMLTAAYLQGVEDCAVATFKKEQAASQHPGYDRDTGFSPECEV